MKNLLKYTLLLVILLGMVSLACGGSTNDVPEVVSTESPAAETDQEVTAEEEQEIPQDEPQDSSQDAPEKDADPTTEYFSVGDVIEIQGHTIALNSVEYFDTGILQTNFTITNASQQKELNISSILLFSAKKSDGIKLDQEIFDCGTGLDGSVMPGDKLRGNICWGGASEADGIKIYYDSNFFSGGGTVVWLAEEGAVEVADTDAGGSSLEITPIGETVAFDDHTIRLSSVEYLDSGTLMVGFLVINTGSEGITVSSIMSVEAKKEDGTKLTINIFDCGPGFDGNILPGDNLKGYICWEGASPEDGIKIYYQSDFVGGDSVVWAAVEGAAGEDIAASPTVKIFAVEEIAKLQTHTIVINTAEYQNGKLKVNFTITNTGSGQEELNISSLMSFDARTTFGEKLKQDYFDCGTSLDGTILPGDLLRGDICWEGAEEGSGVKVFYQGDLGSSNVIPWMP